MPLLYHYTTITLAESIDAAGHIRPAVDKVDGLYGEGVYFTDILPVTISQFQMARKLYGGNGIRKMNWEGCLDVSLQLFIPDCFVSDMEEHNGIYVFKGDVDIPLLGWNLERSIMDASICHFNEWENGIKERHSIKPTRISSRLLELEHLPTDFYHYTTWDQRERIELDLSIRPSVDKKVGKYGEGVYFTDICPEFISKIDMAEKLYGPGLAAQKIKEGELSDWINMILPHCFASDMEHHDGIYLYKRDTEIPLFTVRACDPEAPLSDYEEDLAEEPNMIDLVIASGIVLLGFAGLIIFAA